MTDPTESIRRRQVAQINAEPGSREDLESRHGRIWDVDEFRREFEAVGFMAPYVVVRRRRDGVTGSLMFQYYPRFYFCWWEDRGDRDKPRENVA